MQNVACSTTGKRPETVHSSKIRCRAEQGEMKRKLGRRQSLKASAKRMSVNKRAGARMAQNSHQPCTPKPQKRRHSDQPEPQKKQGFNKFSLFLKDFICLASGLFSGSDFGSFWDPSETMSGDRKSMKLWSSKRACKTRGGMQAGGWASPKN